MPGREFGFPRKAKPTLVTEPSIWVALDTFISILCLTRQKYTINS